MTQPGPGVEVCFVLEDNGCREENMFYLEFKVTQILGYRPRSKIHNFCSFYFAIVLAHKK